MELSDKGQSSHRQWKESVVWGTMASHSSLLPSFSLLSFPLSFPFPPLWYSWARWRIVAQGELGLLHSPELWCGLEEYAIGFASAFPSTQEKPRAQTVGDVVIWRHRKVDIVQLCGRRQHFSPLMKSDRLRISNNPAVTTGSADQFAARHVSFVDSGNVST